MFLMLLFMGGNTCVFIVNDFLMTSLPYPKK